MMKIKLCVWFLIFIWMTSCKGRKDAENATTPKRENSANSGTVKNRKSIVFFGNSLTAGYGLDPSEAFPAVIQQKIDSMQLSYKVVNAGLSGETSAGGNTRVDWVLNQPVDIFVLELGGNDGLRGIPLEETRKNLQSIIDKVKARNPETKIILAGMRVPPNMGKTYSDGFYSVFRELSKKNQLAFVPFLLEGVGGEKELNQADGIHPTAEGHKIVAENVWTVLKGLLQ